MCLAASGGCRGAWVHNRFPHPASAQNLWEVYRQKAVTLADKRESIDKVLDMWKGSMKTLCARHDASRVIQSVFQFGTVVQQEKVMAELRGHLLDMSKEKHAHNILEKILKYGSPSMKAAVHKELKGHAARLMTHKMGILVLEAGYAKAWSTADTWELLQEAYGPQYAHLKVTPAKQAPVAHLLGTGALPPPGCAEGGEDVATLPPAKPEDMSVLAAKRSLDSLLAEHPSEKLSVLRNLYHHINKFVAKGFLGTTIGQRLLADFLRVASPLSIRQVVPTITDAIVALVSSRDGMLAACIALAYATTKERKVILSSIKAHVAELALHDQGHMLLVKALDCVDDTVQLTKAILKPLSAELDLVRDVACDRFGRRVWLHLLAPGSSRYFPQTDMQLLQPVWVPEQEEEEQEEGTAATGQRAPVRDLSALEPAGQGAEEEAGDAADTVAATGKRKSRDGALDLTTVQWQATSKKSAPIRRKQLLKAALPKLRDAMLVHTADFMRSRWGAEVLLETVKAMAEQAALPKGVATPSDVQQVLEAVAEAVREDSEEGGEEEDVQLAAAAGAGQAAASIAVRSGVHFGGGDEGGDSPTPARAGEGTEPWQSLVENAASTLLLKRLLLLERETPASIGQVPIGEMLWDAVAAKYGGPAGDGTALLQHNRGCFLLSDLAQSPSAGEAVRGVLGSKAAVAALKAADPCSGKAVLGKALGVTVQDAKPAGKPLRGTKRASDSAAPARGGKRSRK